VKGAFTLALEWLGKIDLAKRLLAYLFRQQLDRMADRNPVQESTRPLPAAVLAAFRPGDPAATQLRPTNADEIDEFVGRINRQGHGVFAVVGERGSGRTTILQQAISHGTNAIRVNCPFGGLPLLVRELGTALQQPDATNLDELQITGETSCIVLDNLHRLIEPVMGGTSDFNRLIDFLRRHSGARVWIVAMDQIAWRFVSQARGTSFLFDEVLTLEGWSEEDIAELLRERTRSAANVTNLNAYTRGVDSVLVAQYSY
jgi:hypothetical protein